LKPTKHIPEDQNNSEVTGRNVRSVEHEQTVIPVVQEELDVETRRVETESGVRVTKSVQEREEIIDEPLTKEEVDIERVSIDRAVDAPVAVRYEGETMIIPVLEEVLVVEKRLMLKEEIRVTRRRREFHAPERVTLRREIASVERTEGPDAGSSLERADHLPRAGTDSPESLLEQKRRQQEELRRALDPSPKHK
jgi:uncharacterized protein (TIGR02271 family)